MKQPRSPNPSRDDQQNPAPARALHALEAVASKDIVSARYALGLYNALLGPRADGVFPRHGWCLSPGGDLPAGVAAAARALIKWALGPHPRRSDIYSSRIRLLEGIAKLRRRSPFGQRSLQVANALREKYPSATPYRVPEGTPAATGIVPVLENAVGQPVSEITVRLVQTLGPSVIRVVGQGDSMPWGLEPGSATIRLGADGCTVEEITWAVAIASSAPRERIEGVLCDFFETGTEGMIWSLIDDEAFGREGVHFIEPGDHLTICDSLGYEKWSGTIRCDRRTGWQPYPGNPEHGQPVALGCQIHWTQRGFTPDKWAGFFMRPEVDRFRGVLTKKPAGGRPKQPE